MAISYVGSASNESTSVTLPTHQAGDLIIIAAMRSTSTVNSTVPSGWTLIGANTGLNTDNLMIAFKIATTASETSGTWTDAEFMVAIVYRDSSNYLVSGYRVGSRSVVSPGSSTPSFGAKSAWATATVPGSESSRMIQASSWVVGVISSPLTAVTLSPVPSGMTNRITATGASSRQIAIHDTNGNVASWAATNATLSGNTTWINCVFDLADMGVAKSSGGLSVARGMTGGMQ